MGIAGGIVGGMGRVLWGVVGGVMGIAGGIAEGIAGGIAGGIARGIAGGMGGVLWGVVGGVMGCSRVVLGVMRIACRLCLLACDSSRLLFGHLFRSPPLPLEDCCVGSPPPAHAAKPGREEATTENQKRRHTLLIGKRWRDGWRVINEVGKCVCVTSGQNTQV